MNSLADIYRQVQREGLKWGLFPVMAEDRVKVCEKVKVFTRRKGHPTCVEWKTAVVMSLRPSSPPDAFSRILAQRMTRDRKHYLDSVKNFESSRKAKITSETDDRIADFYSTYKPQIERGRTVFTYG